MVGSWVGRSLVALPAMLASIAAGLIVAGLTRELVPSIALVALLCGIVLLRVTTIGVIIDLERQQIVLRTFWWTRRIAVEDLLRIDAQGIGDSWPPGVRFLTTNGREYGSMALCYLDEDRAERFIGQLRSAVGADAEISLLPSSFRPSAT